MTRTFNILGLLCLLLLGAIGGAGAQTTTFLSAKLTGSGGQQLASYTTQAGDVSATFAKRSDASSGAIVQTVAGSSVYSNVSGSSYYLASSASPAGKIALSVAVYMPTAIDIAGLTFADDGTGQNYWSLGINNVTHTIDLTKVVGGTASVTTAPFTGVNGTNYNLEIDADPAAQTVTAYCYVSGTTRTPVSGMNALSVSGLTITSNKVGLFYKTSSAHSESTGIWFNTLLGTQILQSTPVPPASVAAVPAPGSVSITWAAVSGASSYSVYRGTASGAESATAIATGIVYSSYTDPSGVNGTNYYYIVKAVNQYGASAASSEAGPVTPAITAVPTGITAAKGEVSAYLSWGFAAGATSYNIKQGASSSGPFTTVTTATLAAGLVSGLTDGQTYYFVVSSVSAAGESANSAPVSIVPALGAITLTMATISPGATQTTAPGSGGTDVGAALQAAMNGGGSPSDPLTIDLQGGTWLVSGVAGLNIYSYTTLKNGKLCFTQATGPRTYNSLPAGGPYDRTRLWNAHLTSNAAYQPVSDTSITLAGLTLYCNGQNQQHSNNVNGWTMGVELVGVTNPTLTGVSIIDSSTFSTYFMNCTGVTISGSSVSCSSNHGENTDGWHFGGPCQVNSFSSCSATNTNDDPFALEGRFPDVAAGESNESSGEDLVVWPRFLAPAWMAGWNGGVISGLFTDFTATACAGMARFLCPTTSFAHPVSATLTNVTMQRFTFNQCNQGFYFHHWQLMPAESLNNVVVDTVAINNAVGFTAFANRGLFDVDGIVAGGLTLRNVTRTEAGYSNNFPSFYLSPTTFSGRLDLSGYSFPGISLNPLSTETLYSGPAPTFSGNVLLPLSGQFKRGR